MAAACALLLGCSRPAPTVLEAHGALLIDRAAGRAWLSCARGQALANGRCEGIAVQARWEDAQAFCHAGAGTREPGWRLPSPEELAAALALAPPGGADREWTSLHTEEGTGVPDGCCNVAISARNAARMRLEHDARAAVRCVRDMR